MGIPARRGDNVDSFWKKVIDRDCDGRYTLLDADIRGVETCAMRRFTKYKPVPTIATTTAMRFSARVFMIMGATSSC